MITITKQNDGVLFTFENSDKYLYGNGTIEVPFNTLSIVADESDMITLKKAASNDVFISARYDTDLGYRSKDDAIDDLKDLLFAETGGGSGSGVTPSEVQEMIDESISGMSEDIQSLELTKADTSAVTAVDNALSAYSATTDARIAEDEEVTAAALNDLDENKQDALEYYSEAETEDSETGETDKYGQIEVADELNGAHVYADYFSTNEEKNPYASIDAWVNDGEGNEKQNRVYADADGVGISADENADDGEGNIVHTTSNVSVSSTEIGMNVGEEGDTTTTLSITSTGVTINNENVATEPYVNAAITGKVDTSAITTSITSGSTDAQVPSAKATYEAITAATTGGGATYSAGTNISIANDTINCTLNLRNGTGQNSIVGVQGEAKGQYNFAFGQNSTAGTVSSDGYAFAFGYGAKARKGRSFAYGSTVDVKEIDSAAFGQQITLNAPRSFSAGYHNVTNNWTNIALGEELTTNNRPEFATGAYNNSVTGSTASGQTLFSVGNGTSSARHNAFEIRQNGDIYVNDGTNDVRLQDTILALGGLKFVQCTQAQYDALVSGGTVDSSTIYFITNVVS